MEEKTKEILNQPAIDAITDMLDDNFVVEEEEE
jgi:hypothetical protein